LSFHRESSLYFLVCCSIFNDLATALRDSLYIIPLSSHFVNPFFKVFLSFLMICETFTTRKLWQGLQQVQFAQRFCGNTPFGRFEGCILL
ncbi:MAG: hypothetical protein IKK74_05865, partial [Clostridia bacterium]|nr:hypothetical protein [Clostridia bacterium]